MLGTPSPAQQQQRIDELAEAINILSGQVAALTTLVAVMMPIPDPGKRRQLQGHAQNLAPSTTSPYVKTPPKKAASDWIERIAGLAVRLQTPTLPGGSLTSKEE